MTKRGEQQALLDLQASHCNKHQRADGETLRNAFQKPIPVLILSESDSSESEPKSCNSTH